MAIVGAHMLVYSTDADATRAAFRDVFGWPHVDAGHGWLIFALPPAEIGVHPSEGPTFDSGIRHQITLMCDDIHTTIKDLRAKGVRINGEPKAERYGIHITITLPGDVEIMVYQPLHETAIRIGKME